LILASSASFATSSAAFFSFCKRSVSVLIRSSSASFSFWILASLACRSC
jgi:hypothetical protein